jgi:hypothetical protein
MPFDSTHWWLWVLLPLARPLVSAVVAAAASVVRRRAVGHPAPRKRWIVRVTVERHR